MPRFVLLRHECPPEMGQPNHWDLMLEDAGALLTWRVELLPTSGGAPVAAVRLANHRLDYLQYEGPLSDNRGEVRRVDAGEFQWLERSNSRARIALAGHGLAGVLVIEELDDRAARLFLAPAGG